MFIGFCFYKNFTYNQKIAPFSVNFIVLFYFIGIYLYMIYCMYMKKINEIETNDIDMKPFNVKDKLNPEFFDKEGQLNSQIRLKLLDIADDFIDSLKIKWVKPSDIVLTGSIANYNWSKYSDVDIHIIYNYSDVYKKTDFVKDYFNSKKELWNSTHTELTIKDFPVEISVEDSSDPAKSTGVYSLEKNKWVKEPENMNDSKLNKEYIKKFCAKQMSKLDKLFDEMDNETDKVKIKKISDEIENLYTKLKDMRGEGLASSEKEMSTGNIIWKVIKHMGYIEKLWNYINNAYDRANTIDEKINGKIVRLSEAQAKLIKEGGNPGYGNIYLDSWLGRFKKALKNNTITTADLHSAIQRMGIKQVSPSVYNKKDIEMILNDRRAQLRKLLGIEPLSEPVKPTPTRPSHFEQPQQPVHDNDGMPAANMENFINLSDVSELNEAAMPGFNLQTLSSIKSFAGRLKYCKQMLGPSFGSGSSRIIFEIDDEKVLKLAKNKKGVAQNEFEEQTSRYGSMVVHVFDCDDNYMWLVEENCVPAKEEDFERLIGLPFETYCDLIRFYYNRYCRNGRQTYLFTMTTDEADALVDRLYNEDDDGFVPRIFNLMGDYQLPFGDLTRISTYGMVMRDGSPELVVIDSGLSEEILNTYYRR